MSDRARFIWRNFMSFNKRWNDKASHDVIRNAIIEFLVLIIFNFFFRDTIFSSESHSLLLNKTPFMSWRAFLLESRHLNIYQDFACYFFRAKKTGSILKAFDHKTAIGYTTFNVHRCSLKLDLTPTSRLLALMGRGRSVIFMSWSIQTFINSKYSRPKVTS